MHRLRNHVDDVVGGSAVSQYPKTDTAWRLEVEWDRKMNTGSYERHDTKMQAEIALLYYRQNDPPARWRIFKVTITYSDMEGEGVFAVNP